MPRFPPREGCYALHVHYDPCTPRAASPRGIPLESICRFADSVMYHIHLPDLRGTTHRDGRSDQSVHIYNLQSTQIHRTAEPL